MGLYNNVFKKLTEYGEVVEVAHPVVTIVGLPNVKINEMIVFDNDEIGQVQSIKKDTTNIIIFSKIPAKVGQKVTRLNELLQITMTQDLLGKVVGPMGQIISSIDTGNDIKTDLERFLLIVSLLQE